MEIRPNIPFNAVNSGNKSIIPTTEVKNNTEKKIEKSLSTSP